MALSSREKETAVKLYQEGCSYTEIARQTGRSYDEVRNFIRRSPCYRPKTYVGEGEPTNEQEDVDPATSLLRMIQRPTDRSMIKNAIGVTDRVLDAMLGDLIENGYQIDHRGEEVLLSKTPHSEKQTLEVDWKGNKIIRFGVLSDTHIGSKWTQLTHLHDAYRKFDEEGIKHVYHVGDITEGWKMRQGHEHECYIHGADDYVDEVVRVYPCIPGIKTYFITGNHDLSFVKHAGVDIGIQIAKDRSDMIYLGQEAATVNLTPDCIMELLHPRDAGSYAVSYRPQKIVESLEGGTKPNILLIGHYHKRMDTDHRNVEIVLPGAMQAQTPWMRGKAIASVMGYYIIEIEVTETGQIDRFKPEFFKKYVPIDDDYKNWRE